MIYEKCKMEIWKDIPGYVGLYQVSTHGRVKSLDRTVKHSTYGEQPIVGRVLKPAVNKRGYSHVQLSKNGTSKSNAIHQLVMMAFVGSPQENEEVIHLESVKTSNNNKLSNLRYASKKCNAAFRNDDETSTVGERHPGAILTEKDVAFIKLLLKTKGNSQAKISRVFGVNSATIGKINRGETWGWVKPKTPSTQGVDLKKLYLKGV